jgi:mono/diheme cytochrome c family protein
VLVFRRDAMLLTILLLFLVPPASATSSNEPHAQDDGRELYRAACAACHGLDGRGQPRATVGFDTPLPDFTDCAFATPEPDVDWMAVIHRGGPVRAFDRRMPAFGEVLTDVQIQQTIAYVRSFCTDRTWPRGELNLPRPLVTEKAFPENETVFSTTITRGDSAAVETEVLYERRLGARTQLEAAVPVAIQKDATGDWHGGLGDTAFALKRVLFHALDSGTIISVAAEVVLPTGKETRGFGGGTTVFEPFVAIGHMLPANAFVQFQGGFEIPWNRDTLETEGFWRTTIGKSFVEDRFGRSWTPMLEITGARALEGGEPADWDVVPQMQVTLSRRQHIMVNAGVRIPLTNRAERDTQFLTYLLWDWFEGGLFDGWR